MKFLDYAIVFKSQGGIAHRLISLFLEEVTYHVDSKQNTLVNVLHED